MKRVPLLATATLLISVALAPLPASAAGGSSEPDSLQARVDAVMRAVPDGVQIADDSVAWQHGEIVLVLEGGSNARSLSTCSTGSYCAWSAVNYNGSKLSFTACSVGGTSSSLAPLLTNARSLANKRTSGTVHAKNGSSVVWTLGPSGGVPSNAATLTTMVCFS